MKNRQEDTELVLSLFEQLGIVPEKEIFLDSQAEDFFNVVAVDKDGSKRGVIALNFPNGKQIPLFVELSDDMTHEALYMSISIVLFTATVFADYVFETRRGKDKSVYSAYEPVLGETRQRLLYVNRRLRRVQKRFHDAEGKLHRALMLKAKKTTNNVISEESMYELEARADECMQEFCETFALHQRLSDDYKEIQQKDAHGKKILETFPVSKAQMH